MDNSVHAGVELRPRTEDLAGHDHAATRRSDRRELELIGAISAAANEARSLESALAVAVDALCEFLGWPVGHAWTLDSRGDLISSRLWFGADEKRFDSFRDVTEETVLSIGVGLPGRVLACGGPAWIEDMRTAPNVPRLERLPDAPVRGAFAFPVYLGSEIVSIIEVFSDRPEARNEHVLALTSEIAAHLGRVVERERSEARLAHAAGHDPLTELPNRTLFIDRLEQVLARARRTGSTTCLYFLDLDNFKSINDTISHEVGDRLLCKVAERLQGVVREEDTIARLGGDEFVFVFDRLADETDAIEMAERIHGCLQAPMRIAGREELVTASIGIAITTAGETDAGTLMSEADAAMYRAKGRGRGEHEVFSDDLREEVHNRASVERALWRALDNNELRLHFQPIIDLASREVKGCEALVRWEDPATGMRSPAEFIPVAEASSLIEHVGLWVLQDCCLRARRWRDDPALARMLPINVNVAAKQLGDPGFADTVEATLRESGVEPSEIALEITESALIEHTHVPVRTLSRLSALGMRISLDDFGTGYSSLGYLTRFPVNVLKIDRSFVAGIGQEGSASGIVEAIVGMGRALGIEVLAEGVETAEQATELQRMGCVSAQGFYFTRPAPV